MVDVDCLLDHIRRHLGDKKSTTLGISVRVGPEIIRS